jgi:hypothetical protein
MDIEHVRCLSSEENSTECEKNVILGVKCKQSRYIVIHTEYLITVANLIAKTKKKQKIAQQNGH